MPDSTTDWLYLFNIVLGTSAFTWLLIRTSRRWDEYPGEIQKLLAVLLAFVFALLVTTGEQFVLHLPLSASAFIICTVKLFLLYTLWTTRNARYRTGIRHTDRLMMDHRRDDASVDPGPDA